HRLPAPSAPKRENAFDLHQRIRRRSDGGVLSATLSLRLPFSINATTDCSGCSVRCPSAFRFVILQLRTAAFYSSVGVPLAWQHTALPYNRHRLSLNRT